MNRSKVQKKNKNKKNSPFWAYALEFKQQQLARGVPIHNDQQLKEMAGNFWSKLSDKQKESYKDKALKSDPIANKNRTVYDCFGRDINVVEAERHKQLEEYQAMKDEIALMLENANDIGELDSLVFYFISTSSFYDSSREIYPAELAMSKFSLKEGVHDDIQIRINPGNLPLGSAHEAIEKADKTHKYPMPPNCEGEQDYMSILEAMMKFLHPMEKLPVFFSEGDNRDLKLPLHETRKIVRKVFYESQEDDMLADIKIYPMEELLYQLQCMTVTTKNRRNGTNDAKFSSVVYAGDRFNGGQFSLFTKGCDFHNNQDATQHCCLSKVRHYGYTLVHWCSDAMRYDLIEGKHYPDGFKLSKK